jgi:predicted enzyme related to lactoylglutathione lyase
MVKIKKIAFTVYPVTDMARARKFYEEQLGLKKTQDYGGEWVEYDLAGGCFAITTMMSGKVAPSAKAGGSIAFEVDGDVDQITSSLKAQGVPVILEPFSSPVCRMSVVCDPEGNAVTIHRVNRAA